jgi:hypothetical protein
MVFRNLLAAVLLADSWYPETCCGGQNCHPVACDEISEHDDGYHWRNLVFLREQVQPTQDRDCHVCHSMTNGKPSLPHCIFIRPTA